MARGALEAKLYGQRIDDQLEKAWEEQRKERDVRWSQPASQRGPKTSGFQAFFARNSKRNMIMISQLKKVESGLLGLHFL